MTGIDIRFVGGRYHATPWGSHVNEAAVAWPPEPWRILRALVGVWHRKADRQRFPEPVLAALVEDLGATLPIYRLPRATHSHTQHYMPAAKGKKTQVFDGFLRVAQDDPLIVWWPQTELGEEESELLDHLLARLGYLGRAESWVEASRSATIPQLERSAVPLEDGATPEPEHDVIEVLAPLPPAAYREWRAGVLDEGLESLGLSTRSRNKALDTLPVRFLDLLRLETSDVQAAGWSQSPGTRWVRYQRPEDWDQPDRESTRQRARSAATTARLALVGRPLPRIEDAVKVGESMRAAILSQFDEREPRSEDRWVIHGRREGERDLEHQHAFFLPEDADGDGWIDHVLVHAKAGLGESVELIAAVRKLWLRQEADKGKWRVLFEGAGRRDDFARVSRLLGPARRWRSATPYLHPWFAKKGFGAREQLEKELGLRATAEGLGLAERPTRLKEIRVHGTRRLPTHFHRFRFRRGLRQPDRKGSFWELEFEQEIVGPLALGFAAHYGLGLFLPFAPRGR